MMNLTTAFNAMRSSIAARSLQTSVTAENIANVDNPNYTRRLTQTTGAEGNGVYDVSVIRASDNSILRHFFSTTSDSTSSKAIVDGLSRLESIIGDPENETSPSALIAKFKAALHSYSSLPNDQVIAENTVAAASAVARGLNEATRIVQQTRAQTDAQISSSVNRINSLLEQYHTANSAIVRGAGSASDLASYLDARDAALSSLSEELDITTVTGSNNNVSIYAGGGAVLYEDKPRTVSFTPTSVFSATTSGNQVFVDGVMVTGSKAMMKLGSGRLSGLVKLRDDLTGTFQNQLDEIARGLIETFAEKDQSAVPALPDAAGLFTWDGGPSVPASGVVSVGLAGKITINANVDPAAGGNMNLLRDGGISDPGNPAYTYNTTGAAGFSDRLSQLFSNMDDQRSFDPATNIGGSKSLTQFADSSAAWFENLRATSTDKSEYHSALLARTSQALSRSTGVNLDNELALMTELERSYEASARLMKAIDTMYSSLLGAMR